MSKTMLGVLASSLTDDPWLTAVYRIGRGPSWTDCCRWKSCRRRGESRAWAW